MFNEGRKPPEALAPLEEIFEALGRELDQSTAEINRLGALIMEIRNKIVHIQEYAQRQDWTLPDDLPPSLMEEWRQNMQAHSSLVHAFNTLVQEINDLNGTMTQLIGTSMLGKPEAADA
ncbi:TPA: hypothetical protein DDZ10_02625 [Candidatus Uhrbacteria bacterium]|nr:hypothetical protein [Candidatus Uhrbacteria bacterium]